MNGCITPSIKRPGIILLFAVVGQRLPRYLTAGNSASVRKHRDKQSVYMSLFLQKIEDWHYSLIYERNCPDLNSDRFPRSHGTRHCSRSRQQRTRSRFQKSTACCIISQDPSTSQTC